MKKYLLLGILVLASFSLAGAARAFSFSDFFSIFMSPPPVSDQAAAVSTTGTGILIPERGLPTSSGSGSCASVPLPPGQNLQTVVCLNGAWQATSALQISGLNLGDWVRTDRLCLGGDCRTSWPSGGGTGGVSRIIAGSNVTISPSNGTGEVTINSTATGGTGGVGGSGTTNFLSKWVNSNTLGNSQVSDNGQGVGIGVNAPDAKLDINGQIKIRGGQPGAGKVLTSDPSGLASWQAPTGGGEGFWEDAGGSSIRNTNVGGIEVRNESSPGSGNLLGAILGNSLSGYGVWGVTVGSGQAGVQGDSRSGSGVAGVTQSGRAVSAVTGTSLEGSPVNAYGFHQSIGAVPPGSIVRNYLQSPLGIGTQNPQETFHIRAAVPRIAIEDSDGNGARASISGNSTVGGLYLQSDFANIAPGSEIGFDVDGQRKMQLTSQGNLGIGTEAPTERLDLAGGNIKMGYQIVTANSTGNSSQVQVFCPTGKKVLGGGCGFSGETSNTGIVNSYPSNDVGWNCGWNNLGQVVTAYAICANIR